VPTAYPTIGRFPGPNHGIKGTITVPVTAIGSPWVFSLRYITFRDWASGVASTVVGSTRITVPGAPTGSGVGGL
jgi:hypothetical protein